MLKKDLGERTELPNGFSIEIGDRIRAARNQKGLTQGELAIRIYKRRPSLSEIENGRMLPNAFTLLLTANRLEKPLDYFIPEMYRKAQPLEEGELSNLEKELVAEFRRIWDRRTKELILRRIKAVADAET